MEDVRLHILSFPVELIHHIAKYLPGNDLLSLSNTCSQFKYYLNHDSVWKNHIIRSKELQELKWKERKLETLSKKEIVKDVNQPCKNLDTFLKQKQIIFNWKRGNFKKYSVNLYKQSRKPRIDTPENGPAGFAGLTFYKNHHVFIGNTISRIFKFDRIDLWDVKHFPFIQDTLYQICERYFVVENYLVVLNLSNVMVYQINVNSDTVFTQVFAFKITDQESSGDENEMVNWISFTEGQYLFCKEEMSQILHVWDIKNRIKIGTYTIPLDNCLTIRFCNNDNNMLLLEMSSRNHDVDNGVFYFYFDLVEKTFSDQVYHCSYSNRIETRYFYKNFIITSRYNDSGGLSNLICTVYDLKDKSKVVSRREFNNPKIVFRLNSTDIVNGTFILYCDDTYKIVDAVSLDIVLTIPTDNPGLHYSMHHFDVLDSLFVVNTGFTKKGGKEYHTQIIDLKSDTIIILKGFLDHFLSSSYLNDTSSILISKSGHKLNIIHFW